MRVAKCLLWCVGLLLMAPSVSAVDCSTCDCVHLPCPPSCKSCCGISRGRIEFVDDSILKLDNGDTFVMGKSVSAKNENQEKEIGANVTVYFKKLGDAKVAEKVATQSKADTAPK
jgi:hypothetical protein